MRVKSTKQRGITLIALVITIIEFFVEAIATILALTIPALIVLLTLLALPFLTLVFVSLYICNTERSRKPKIQYVEK